MSDSFSKGEIVWAKVKGFRWWPAIVFFYYFTKLIFSQIGNIFENKKDESKKQEFYVNFIGENTQLTANTYKKI